jgi:hypothetical protein
MEIVEECEEKQPKDKRSNSYVGIKIAEKASEEKDV